MNIKDYLKNFLNTLGQMNHISLRHTVEGKCEKCQHPYKKTEILGENGIMSMKVSDRRDIIANGWDIVKELEKDSK
jgi:hypothetical protein